MAISRGCLAAQALPSVDVLRRELHYDPITGALTRAIGKPGASLGSRAGSRRPDGYVTVGVLGDQFFAHRIAWKLHHGEEPPALVDHRNGDRSDNRIANLRAATVAENGANRGRDRRTLTGLPGVSLCRQTGKYRASIRVAGRLLDLGRHQDLDAATRARAAAEATHFGAFGAGNRQEARLGH